jgi:hypothetical protein
VHVRVRGQGTASFAYARIVKDGPMHGESEAKAPTRSGGARRTRWTKLLMCAHVRLWADRKIDTDDPEHLQWLFRTALERALQYNIQGVSYRLTQGVVKNIIPAIASTNAIIAGQYACPHVQSQGPLSVCVCVQTCLSLSEFVPTCVSFSVCVPICVPRLSCVGGAMGGSGVRERSAQTRNADGPAAAKLHDVCRRRGRVHLHIRV